MVAHTSIPNTQEDEVELPQVQGQLGQWNEFQTSHSYQERSRLKKQAEVTS